MVNDTISDMLTRIRNRSLVKKRTVIVPFTRLNLKISEILEKEGFIHSFEPQGYVSKKTGLSNEKDLNLVKPKEIKISLKYYKKFKTKYYKLSRLKNTVAFSVFKNLIKHLRGKQIYKKVSCITNLRRISKPGLRIYVNHKELPRILGGAGIVILSTSKGVMTDREARFRGIGGEVLCSVW
uniref:ribosomal protein S8 n=1 Tax=Gormaniella terricola TaxID=2904618 RepID=UPI0021CC7933|nr:ribosomal protein S8 [Gormaniella terricola]UWV18298.1 ribosomal protein S8 [Gormaniella terricola]